MGLTEKVSYLKGLMDGLEFDKTTKEGKLLVLMTEILEEAAEEIELLSDELDEMTELVDTIDQDLGDVEREVFDLDEDCSCDDNDYGDEDFGDEDFDDEELYECVCPSCGDSICIGENILADGGITCPNCGEVLEFDYSEEEAPESEEKPTEE